MCLQHFERRHFDLILLSYVLEYQAMPLGLLSLTYEILQPQGYLLSFVPHRLQPQGLKVGYPHGFWGLEVRRLLAQAAFTPQSWGSIHANLWRPGGLVHLACPQVPPRPQGRVSFPNPLSALMRARRMPGIAATGQKALERAHD